LIVQAPTGAGKTVIAAAIIDGALSKGRRVVWFSHSETLGNQAIDTFDCDVQRLFSGDKLPEHYDVLVTMAKTLKNCMYDIAAPDVVIIDEAHHAAASTYTTIMDHWPDAKVVGFTATPERLDGKPLKAFDQIIDMPSPRWFIDQGYLADYHYLAPPMELRDLAALNEVKNVAGDWSKKGLQAFVEERPSILGNAVQHYIAHALNTQCLVFCVGVKAAKMTADAFWAEGIPAAYLSGAMKRYEREDIISRFKAGKIKVLTSCMLIGEGFNIPAVQSVILMRPTKSLTIYLQQVGRVLRPKEDGSKAIILDMVNNVKTHGLPCIEREWSLEGKVKREKPEQLIRTCDSCLGVFENMQYQSCPSEYPEFPCGLMRQLEGERKLKEEEGELVRIDQWREEHPEWTGRRSLKLMELAEAKKLARGDWAKLHAIARAKGYKPGIVHFWAKEKVSG
jgi:superfamily II DNA or RNA helicase